MIRNIASGFLVLVLIGLYLIVRDYELLFIYFAWLIGYFNN